MEASPQAIVDLGAGDPTSCGGDGWLGRGHDPSPGGGGGGGWFTRWAGDHTHMCIIYIYIYACGSLNGRRQ